MIVNTMNDPLKVHNPFTKSINKLSRENESDTPDYILGNFLRAVNIILSNTRPPIVDDTDIAFANEVGRYTEHARTLAQILTAFEQAIKARDSHYKYR